MKRSARLGLLLFAAFIVAAGPGAAAQDQAEGGAGIPAYAVARVKVLTGSTWVLPPGGADWEEFPSNSPLPPGSRISIPEDSEAELQFHGGQFVLLTSGTDVDVRDLQENACSFRLRAGEIRFDLPPGDFAPVAVRVPGGNRVRLVDPGRYWLTVTNVGETRMVVRSGRATLSREDGEFRIGAGEQAVIGEDVEISHYAGAEEEASGPSPAETAEALRADVPPTVYGELADYGDWVYAPSYGYVWQPRVAPGWAPYVYGRWNWIDPYGWTWVAYEPWGWYPYRCGRWITAPGLGWAWYPDRAFVSIGFVFGSYHHYYHDVDYRPAMVRFIPEGRGVRWVPLRPGERYRPVEFRRGNPALARWNRPLGADRVFVRSGPKSRRWREWSQVHNERQAQVRRTIVREARQDNRGVRPEITRGKSAPSVREGRTNAEYRTRGGEAQRQKRIGGSGARAPERSPGVGTAKAPKPGETAVKEGRPNRGIAAPRETPPGRTTERRDVRQPAAPVSPSRAPRGNVAPPVRTQQRENINPPAGTQQRETVSPSLPRENVAPAPRRNAPARPAAREPAREYVPPRPAAREPVRESAPPRPVEREPSHVAPREGRPAPESRNRGQGETSVDRFPSGRMPEGGGAGRESRGERADGGGRGR